MKVILTQDIDNLGANGDVVEVKNGYGRNFLIPKGLALEASRGNLKAHQEIRRQTAHKLDKILNDAQALAEKLTELEIVIPARVGEENRIFGTVTTQQIAEKLSERGLDIDRRKVVLREEIRALGVYSAAVRLHADVIADIKIRVVPDADSL